MNIINGNYKNEIELIAQIQNLNVIVNGLNHDYANLAKRESIKAQMTEQKDRIAEANTVIADTLELDHNHIEAKARLEEERRVAIRREEKKRLSEKIREHEKTLQDLLIKYLSAKKDLTEANNKLKDLEGQLSHLETEESTETILARYRFNVHNLYNPYVKKLNQMAGTSYQLIDERDFEPTILSQFSINDEDEDENQQ